jgi:hypothetical protein
LPYKIRIMVTVIRKGTSREAIKSLLVKSLKKKTHKGIDVKKYCGLIQLKDDPIFLQKQWRNEWE